VCALWPPLEAPFEISIVMSPQEARAASNSAQLALLWLTGSRRYVRGNAGLSDPGELAARPGSALLFPGGRERQPLPSVSPLHLIVPDGTWSQARRIERNWFAPHALPRLELDPALPSVYALRRARLPDRPARVSSEPTGAGAPGAVPPVPTSALCTFEAIAMAIGLLGNAPLADTLLRRFAEWARRARWIKAGGASREAPWPVPSPAELTAHPAAAHLSAASSAPASSNVIATDPGLPLS
jgi:DTW domain-containing protein YfiP